MSTVKAYPKTRVTKDSRASLLAKLHIAKKELGLDDDLYRSMLERVTGKRSAAKLSIKELVSMVEEMKSKGWQATTKPTYGRKPVVCPDGRALLRKIEALLADDKKPWSYAEGIAKRMFGVEKLEWCNAEQLRAIVVALIKAAERRDEKG